MAKKLKAFVRFDGSGRIVPSSIILAANKPKVGNWKETTAYECCNYTVNPNCITFTTTIIIDGDNDLDIRIFPILPETILLGTINWGDGTITNFSEFVNNKTTHIYIPGDYTGTICFDNPLEVQRFYIDIND